MKITYLGQAGLLFETGGKTIVIDPYLSDSVAKIEPQNVRRTPIDERFLQIQPDVIVVTHNHADHLDKETLCHYLTAESKTLVLAPRSAWLELRKFGGLDNRYIAFNAGTTWTEDEIVFQAVKAEHSDEYAIGVILSAERKNYYITGDTLYSERVFESLPKTAIDVVFLPVNGVGNNMNFADAKRFAQRIKAKKTVPIHIGTFDNLNAESWDCKNKAIPSLYGEINL
jgi:L-ascorbate 6-phosphate lactonase